MNAEFRNIIARMKLAAGTELKDVIEKLEEAAEATVEADQKVHDELVKKDEKKHEKFKKIVDDAMKELERASKGV